MTRAPLKPAIIDMLGEGVARSEIARRLGCAYSYVCAIAAAEGEGPARVALDKRAVAAMRERGMTIAQIAGETGRPRGTIVSALIASECRRGCDWRRVLDDATVDKMLAEGRSRADVARHFGVNPSAVTLHLARRKRAGAAPNAGPSPDLGHKATPQTKNSAETKPSTTKELPTLSF